MLSSAVAKEIIKNLKGLQGYEMVLPYLRDIAERKSFLGLEKTRYVDDKKITDHYAIIPTGQGLGALASLKPLSAKMYEVIVRRFFVYFLPAGGIPENECFSDDGKSVRRDYIYGKFCDDCKGFGGRRISTGVTVFVCQKEKGRES